MVAAWVLLTYLYFLTLIYGIWDASSDDDFDGNNAFWATISTLFYTFFFAMMMISHVLTVFTSPGEMPKGYEKLHEE